MIEDCKEGLAKLAVTNMKKCIYCSQEKDEKLFSREHVIPKSFGTFGSETPILESVCQECNGYLGQLDEYLARDTLEGVTRYAKGLKSREVRQQKDLVITFPNTPEMGDYANALAWFNGKTGEIMPLPQAHLFNLQQNGYQAFAKDQLTELSNWKSMGLLPDKVIKLFGSKEECDEVIKILKTIFPNFRIEGLITTLPKNIAERKEILVEIQVKISHITKRALGKILFNYAAYYIGEDEVVKSQWEIARNYIRYNHQPLKVVRIDFDPFWGDETEEIRQLPKGYNLRIQNKNSNVLGEIQFYNLFKYDFLLAENHNIPLDKETATRFVPGVKPEEGYKKRNILIAQFDLANEKWIVK